MKIDVFLLTTVCPSPRGEDLLCLGSQFAFSLFCGGFLLAESNPQDYVVSVRVGSFPSIRCVLLYTKTFGSIAMRVAIFGLVAQDPGTRSKVPTKLRKMIKNKNEANCRTDARAKAPGCTYYTYEYVGPGQTVRPENDGRKVRQSTTCKSSILL